MGRLHAPPEVRALLAQVVEQGGRWERTRNGHVRVYTPDGTFAAVNGTTPSDSRGMINFASQLRRAGFKIRRK